MKANVPAHELDYALLVAGGWMTEAKQRNISERVMALVGAVVLASLTKGDNCEEVLAAVRSRLSSREPEQRSHSDKDH